MSVDIAIIAADQPFAESLLGILADSDFPVGKVFALALNPEEGDTVMYDGRPVSLQSVQDFDFGAAQFTFCQSRLNSAISDFAYQAAQQGSIVIDAGGWANYKHAVPLAVASVNSHTLVDYSLQNIVATPCSAATLAAMALKPLQEMAGITRVHLVNLQPVSELGKAGTEALAGETARLLNGKPAEASLFGQQIAFNAVPDSGSSNDTAYGAGYSDAELAIARELPHLLGDESVLVSPSTVSVPVFYGQLLSLSVETREPLDKAQAEAILAAAPYLKLQASGCQTPIEAIGQDPVAISGVRQDLSDTHGLAFWVSADNGRIGSALNCLQIADFLLKNYL